MRPQAERFPELITFHKQVLGWVSTTENIQISHYSLIVRPPQSPGRPWQPCVSPAPRPHCPLLPGPTRYTQGRRPGLTPPTPGTAPTGPEGSEDGLATLHWGPWGSDRPHPLQEATAGTGSSSTEREPRSPLVPRRPLPHRPLPLFKLRSTAQVSRDPRRALLHGRAREGASRDGGVCLPLSGLGLQ